MISEFIWSGTEPAKKQEFESTIQEKLNKANNINPCHAGPVTAELIFKDQIYGILKCKCGEPFAEVSLDGKNIFLVSIESE